MSARGVLLAATFAVWLALMIDCANSVREQRCQKITTPLCQDLGYNTTVMPNIMGHEDQNEANLGLQSLEGFIHHNCSTYLRLFLCSVFTPLCSEDVPGAILACRGLCEEVKKDCLASLQDAGFYWPEQLDCSRFPEPPQLCMQQPPEEDFRDDSLPRDQINALRPRARLCPPNTVPDANNQLCLKKCHLHKDYTEKDKTIYAVWSLFWSISCLLMTTFALLTFMIQPKRFRWPARPLLYLSFCGCLRAIFFLVRWIIGPLTCQDAALLEKPTDSLGCTLIALLQVYIDVAMSLWWCVFAFVWYLTAAKEWSTEAIEKISARLHAVVWSISTVPLVFVLINRNIELDELTGFCQIHSHQLLIFKLCFVLVGLFLALITTYALKNVRDALVCDGRCSYKLERLILRLAVISSGIFLCLFSNLICGFFLSAFYGAMVSVALQFLSAIFAALWVFSSKTFKKWNKILRPPLRNKALQNMPCTKV